MRPVYDAFGIGSEYKSCDDVMASAPKMGNTMVLLCTSRKGAHGNVGGPDC